MKDGQKILISFAALFALYHAAEYMIVFLNSTIGFLLFQLLFFLTAFVLGNWFSQNGVGAWGLPFHGSKNFLTGFILGIFIYAVPFLISIALGIEKIIESPDLLTILKSSVPFAVGVMFSSFSEDILTRGLVFSYFKTKIKPVYLILLSATVYLLNHIYRLGDGMESMLYLFLLGIIFCIPFIISGRLWLTGFMHWSGNTFFFISHNVIQTETNSNLISPNYFFAICLLFSIPVIWAVCQSGMVEKSSN